ncbi:MAG TPA: OmpA family protein [Tepidisphaeraceae bacterium]|nr:OmpA family protein [Tepidisphaeraceae bacterium]
MARTHRILSLAAFGLLTVGCVSQEKYNALKMDRDRYAEQLGQAQNEATGARREAEAYKGQLAAIGNTTGSKDAMVLNLTNQNAELQRQIDLLNGKYSEAMSRVGAGSALPRELTNELSEFARQNPDLVDFDAGRGIVKFKSDVTFAPGSAEVTPAAKTAISRFAQILNSPTASGYELMVAGHTDNTNVVNPATIQAGHRNNWYLSAHRAISVGNALMSDRVSSQRLACTGYADQRPIASNGTDAGKAQNRRVEVLILPTQVRGTGVAAAPGRAAPAKSLNKDNAIKSAGTMNKDSTGPQPTVVTEQKPVINK